MTNSGFAFVALALSLGVLHAWTYLRMEFSELPHLKSEVALLQQQLKSEELKYQLVLNEFQGYRLQVAEVLPHLEGRSNKALEKKAQARALASVTLKSDEPQIFIELSESIYLQGLKNIENKKFNAASQQFTKLLRDYPFSPRYMEAHYHLSEARYQKGEYKLCLEAVHLMMQQFPTSSLTGKSMLRMGQIFERDNRVKDAAQVYQTVIKSFERDAELKSQAEQMLKNLSLMES